MSQKPAIYRNPEQMVEDIIARVGKKIVLGIPLGLGKPNHVVNEFFRRASEDPQIHLTIVTALSLEKPTWSSELERRFLEPFVERVFGGVPDLEYVKALRANAMPQNVELVEFYFKPGAFLGVASAQQNYINSNYTHASRDILLRGINVAAQLIRPGMEKGQPVYSLSCNPEVSLELVPPMREMERQGKKLAIIGQANSNLPFMYGDAVVPQDAFDAVLDDPAYDYRLFGAPKMAVTTPDFWIGLHVSALIKDGGTLQIGIGSLGDALVYGLLVREQHNEVYNELLRETEISSKYADLIAGYGGTGKFAEGITGSTEMLVDGYLHLCRAGIVKRKTYNNIHLQRLANEGRLPEAVTGKLLDDLLSAGAIHERLTQEDVDFLLAYGILREGVRLEAGVLTLDGSKADADLGKPVNREIIERYFLGERLKGGIVIHGGFFLGPESFYRELNEMPEEERRKIFMTTVSNVNQLYGNQELKALQRRHGRFANAGLMVMLSGEVVSDGLENGQVVSGVGGQYNFVSMAHALPDARSILMIRALRSKGKEVKSNVVVNYGHTTIPRHLRDIVVTEYGIADLRGKTDAEIIAELLNITDSRFQDELLNEAKARKKIRGDYQIPDAFRENTPERLERLLAPYKKQGHFPPFPFGTDFTKEELVIGKSLRSLKEKMSASAFPVPSFAEARKMISVPEAAVPYLKRLSLDKPASARETMLQRLVVYALAAQGVV
ncbi:MAG: acetyl-CoA hydrolase/transferase C-terminal domain-containing protein [Thermodesulfobacteriota bacterium]